MKKIIKQFIKQEHAKACSEWKQKIEERYSELFKSEIEVGKWYKTKREGKLLICITDSGDGYDGEAYGKAYGWDNDGDWWDNSSFWLGDLTPATNQEVETALIAEAKRRGLKEGVKSIGTPFLNTTGLHPEGKWLFSAEENTLFDSKAHQYGMFIDGKWATIIEEEKTPRVDYERLKLVAELAEIKEKLNQIESKL